MRLGVVNREEADAQALSTSFQPRASWQPGGPTFRNWGVGPPYTISPDDQETP
jgi:hypothetical protein